MRDWMILCDFDGTIALDDVTDELLASFAAPEWTRIEADWRAGRIGSRECMTAQVALIDASQQAVDTLLDTMVIDPAFPAFVADATRMGMSVMVVSDGLDYAIQRILAGYGLGHLPIRANQLVHDGHRGWSLRSPYASTACAAGSGTCKCRIASDRATTLLVGDGQSDFCLAGTADYVFAKDRLIEHCRIHGIPHAAISDLRGARALLPHLAELTGMPTVFSETLPLRRQMV
ncbi:HAD-IB family phosphatase [Salinisphaera hydrothermalis]|uniref:Phosphoserine phosphatase n=1 Tax=Salinisphaera hydrothermalis (strain C41B8) TaxID=1304275 RepID=A0A084IHD8_SALHC|nr:HAD-IB family phosphatase [Salinisphaera hydrothermalis]KEZ76122.1 phosphoserine phosphatase [Salinisphaera hydrothermalis C41B8]